VKYINGNHGKDLDVLRRPRSEDQQHQIGDPPTDLSLHPFAGLPADPQQRALSGGQEARAEDMSVERLALAVRELLRAEIAAARGREVSFVASLDANRPDRRRAGRRARTVDAVLALPGIAVRGELLLHNHPSGVLDRRARI